MCCLIIFFSPGSSLLKQLAAQYLRQRALAGRIPGGWEIKVPAPVSALLGRFPPWRQPGLSSPRLEGEWSIHRGNKSTWIRVALQHCPRLGPQSPTVVASMGGQAHPSLIKYSFDGSEHPSMNGVRACVCVWFSIPPSYSRTPAGCPAI